MSFLNLPWQWDADDLPPTPFEFSIRRWRRGPITIYRHVHWLNEREDSHTTYWIYLADDFGFGIHLPARWGFGAT